jgi:hypothetical protein
MANRARSEAVSEPEIHCAICGKPCTLVVSEERHGWYCQACDAFTETDVEVED